MEANSEPKAAAWLKANSESKAAAVGVTEPENIHIWHLFLLQDHFHYGIKDLIAMQEKDTTHHSMLLVAHVHVVVCQQSWTVLFPFRMLMGSLVNAASMALSPSPFQPAEYPTGMRLS